MPRYGIRSNSSTSLSSATGGGSVGGERRRRPSSIALSSYAHHSKPILDVNVEGIKRICLRRFKVSSFSPGLSVGLVRKLKLS